MLKLKSLPVAEQTRLLQHRPGTGILIGCAPCPHLSECGGISIDYPIYSCHDLCDCDDPLTCGAACPRNPDVYLAYLREVNGFDLGDVQIVQSRRRAELPHYVPILYHASHRDIPLDVDCVSIPLSQVFFAKSGRLRFSSKRELLAHYCVRETAALVLTGVDTDAKIEPFWKSARSNEICEQLKLLEPTLITTPNFSLLANVPRHDNLINMKRIAVAWAELSQAGHAVALHVNARTERDWQRWLHFILEQRAVHWLAFELDTGARINGKWRYYTQQLAWLASKANRPLNLITRGSFGVGTLRSAFAQVTLLDSNAFSKTRSRMRAALVNGRVRWHRGFTLIGQPIDSLLQHNVDLQMSVSSSAAQSP